MKIVDLQTFRVRPRWLFLRVQTDEGIVGWGEPGAEARVGAVEAAIGELRDRLVGQNPLAIERIWRTLTSISDDYGGPILSSAIAGVDQALWDIAGKAYGVPVYELLGGPVRETGARLLLDRARAHGRRLPRRRSPPRRPPRRPRASPPSR